jgi:hypothetical protein
MIRKYFRLLVELGDRDFDLLYPPPIPSLSELHWTPIDVARRAARFLAPRPGTAVLDIGSGAGKFCLVAAVSTDGIFTGVEYREGLVGVSKAVAGPPQARRAPRRIPGGGGATGTDEMAALSHHAGKDEAAHRETDDPPGRV